MQAVKELKDEHHGIGIMLNIMSSVAVKISMGEKIEAEHLEEMLEFLSGFADKCHHGKEEDILFGQLEPFKPQLPGNIIEDLLAEHVAGRQLIASARQSVRAYKQGDKKALQQVGNSFREYVTLLRAHIAKENRQLFPVIDNVLSKALDDQLSKAFIKLEEEVIGVGKHEEYHAMLNKYVKIYK